MVKDRKPGKAAVPGVAKSDTTQRLPISCVFPSQTPPTPSRAKLSTSLSLVNAAVFLFLVRAKPFEAFSSFALDTQRQRKFDTGWHGALAQTRLMERILEGGVGGGSRCMFSRHTAPTNPLFTNINQNEIPFSYHRRVPCPQMAPGNDADSPTLRLPVGSSGGR